MFKLKEYITCPKCKEEINPGLMNLANHWTTCKKNTSIKKTPRNPLTDEIKRIVKV